MKSTSRSSSRSSVKTSYRSAKSGRYVTKEYAQKHPSTTVKETDRK